MDVNGRGSGPAAEIVAVDRVSDSGVSSPGSSNSSCSLSPFDSISNHDAASAAMVGEAVGQLISDSQLKETAMQAVVANPIFQNHMAAHMVDKVVGLSKREGLRHELRNVGTVAESQRLQKCYPDFVLTNRTTINKLGHAYARDSRELDHRMILERLIRYSDNVVLGKSPYGNLYDTLVKDVGGFVPYHITHGHKYVHCCNPVLDVADHVRAEKTMLCYCSTLGKTMAKNVHRSRFARGLVAASVATHCTTRAQYCTVRAPFVTFVHSTYNIELDDLVMILDRAECTTAFGCFIVDPSVFFLNEGVVDGLNCHFKKFRGAGGELYIEFSFVGDNQLSYVHKFDTYVALLTATALKSNTSDALYIITPEYYTNSTWFFRITRTTGVSIPQQVVTKYLPIVDDGTFEYVHTWEYHTVPVSRTLEHMVPRRLRVPKILMTKLETAAMTATANKFNIENLRQIAATLNTVEIVSGQSVNVAVPLSNDDLECLVYSVYIYAYIKKMETSKLMHLLVEEEGRLRDFYEMGFFGKLWRRFLGDVSSTAHYSESASHPFGNSGDVDMNDMPDIPDELVATKGSQGWAMLCLGRLLRCERYHPIVKLGGMMRLRITDVVNDHVKAMSKRCLPYILMPSLVGCAFNSTVAAQMLREVLPTHGLKMPRCPVVTSRGCCAGVLRKFTVPGDGDCFYHALIRCLDLKMTPQEMRFRLVQSQYMDSFDDRSKSISERLMGEGRIGWANEEVIELAAYEFGCCVCLHVNTDVSRYNDGQSLVAHVDYSNNHFMPLLPAILIDIKPVSVEVDTGSKSSQENEQLLIADYNELIKPTLRSDSEFPRARSDAITESATYYPLASASNFGYASSYALMLNDLLNLELLSKVLGRLVLDVNLNNGSSTQFFADTMGADVTVLNFKPISMDLHNTVKYVNYNDRDIGDVQAKLSRISVKFDVISLNPPHFCDKLSSLDLEVHNLFLANHLQSIKCLADEGTMIVGVPIYGDRRTFQLVSKYAGNFERANVVKSMVVAPHCPWSLLILRGKKKNNDVSVPDMLTEDDGITTMMYNYMRHSILRCVDLDARIARLYENLSQVCAMQVVNAADTIMSNLAGSPRLVSLPVSQFEQIKTELCIDTNKLRPVGGALNVSLGVSFVDETQPLGFPKFDKFFVEKFFPEYVGKNVCDIFDVVYTYYCKEFTTHHLRVLEETFKKRFVIDIDAGAMMRCVRSSNNRSSWVGFYEWFVVAFASDRFLKGKHFVHLDLRPFDLLRGVEITSAHMRAPKSNTFLRKIFDTGSRPAEKLFVDSVMVDKVVTDIAKISATVKSEDKLEKPDRKPVVEVESPVMPVEGGTDANKLRLVNLRRAAPDVIAEYEKYCAKTAEKVLANCEDVRRVINGGHTHMVANDLTGKYKGVAIRIGARQFVGSSDSLRRNRFVYVWNMNGSGVLLNEDDKESMQGYHYACTYDDMSVLTDIDLMPHIRRASGKLHTSDIGLIQAAPGCGKTYSIIEIAAEDRSRTYRILTSTKQGEIEVKERLAMRTKKAVGDKSIEGSVKTIDAYIMHDRSSIELLLIDEALMQHPGKLLVAIHYSRADKIRLFGDVLQVPFINLNKPLNLKYQSAAGLFPLKDVLSKSYRVPYDICTLLDGKYRAHNKPLGFDVGMSTKSNYGRTSPSFAIISIVGVSDLPTPSVNTKVLCFTQAEKDDLSRAGFSVNTVHEYQGREEDNVWLVRLDQKDSNLVFTSEQHAVTAVTRHKVKLIYYTAATGDDCVTSLLKKRVIVGGALYSIANEEHLKDVQASEHILNLVDYNGLHRVKVSLENNAVQKELLRLSNELVQYDYNDFCVDDAARNIQLMIDNFLPGTAVNHNHNMQWLMHHSKFKIEVGSLRYNNCVVTYSPPRYAKMRPLIRSAIHEKVLQTPRNVLTAIAKRNVNVPMLTSVVNIVGESVAMLCRLLQMAPAMNRHPIVLCSEDVVDWYNDQSILPDDLEFDRALCQYSMDNYDFVLKTNAKPILDTSADKIYPQPQTILYQKKFVNAIFCSLWRQVRDRVMGGLLPKMLIYTSVSPDDFSRRLSVVLPPRKIVGLRKIEFDMKKYDKSQGALILEFECLLLKWFKVDRQLIDLWKNAHVYTTVCDRKTKIKFRTWYQRKSGDASTFLGNTLALMVMLTEVIPVTDIVCGLFAGDDSVIYTHRCFETIDTDVLAQKYNLECKMYEYVHQYFCSKFLVAVDDVWFMVPDPLKRAVKLGRRDMANEFHVEDYRKSLADDIKMYGDPKIVKRVAKALSERYLCKFDSEQAMYAMFGVVNNKEHFQELYFSEPGDELCYDPSLQLLEL